MHIFVSCQKSKEQAGGEFRFFQDWKRAVGVDDLGDPF